MLRTYRIINEWWTVFSILYSVLVTPHAAWAHSQGTPEQIALVATWMMAPQIQDLCVKIECHPMCYSIISRISWICIEKNLIVPVPLGPKHVVSLQEGKKRLLRWFTWQHTPWDTDLTVIRDCMILFIVYWVYLVYLVYTNTHEIFHIQKWKAPRTWSTLTILKISKSKVWKV